MLIIIASRRIGTDTQNEIGMGRKTHIFLWKKIDDRDIAIEQNDQQQKQQL